MSENVYTSHTSTVAFYIQTNPCDTAMLIDDFQNTIVYS